MLLIDCYNLLHAPMPASLAGLDEIGLCRALVRAGLGGEGAVLACDGKPKPHAPAGAPLPDFPEIRIAYAGPDSSADALLAELIDADHTPRRLLVVSTDRQVQKAARRRRARTMTSARFVGALAEALAARRGARRGQETAKPGGQGLTPEQVRRWARELGVEAPEGPRQGPGPTGRAGRT